MAFEGRQIPSSGLTASTDLSASANLFKAVKMTGAKTVSICTAATDKAIGILQNTPASGQGADVCFFGISKAIVGASVTAGDTLTVDSSSRAVTGVEGTDTTKYRLGIVLEASTAANGIATILVSPGGRLA